MKRLFLVLKNPMHEEIFSDFIDHIDCVDSHTVVYRKEKYSEADVLRCPFDLHSIDVQPGIIYLQYDNGLTAEITRK